MLKGDLTTTPIEIALGALAAEEATGCLHVVDDDGSEALIYLKAGLVYAVSVPGQRPQLGARLISSNALVPENLAEALEAQRTELQGWRLGELLVHLGFVEQDVVEAFVQEQVRDGLTDLLAWTSGRWRFRKAEKTREDVAPPTPLSELLDELRVRKSTWEEIVDAVHGPNAVPMLAAHGGEANITLDPDTWSLLCKIDGERSIADLARECGFTLFEAGTVVRVLVEAGLVDVEEDVGPDGAPVDDSDEPEIAERAQAKSASGKPDSQSGSTGGNYPRTAALAAAFALSGREAADPQPAESGSHALAVEPASHHEAEPDAPPSTADELPPWDASTSWDGAEAADDEETSTLAQVSEALTKALGPRPDSASPFVDPFHVPDEIRLRPPPKAVAALATPDEDQLRQDRIRHAAAAELAAAHAEAEAHRNATKRPKAGHIAQVVDLEARREAARVELERRQAEQAEVERHEAERHEAQRLEAAHVAAEHAAQVEAERLEAERVAAEEAARAAAEEAARVEAERLEAQRVAAEEAARVAAEEASRLEAEEAARLEAERLEAERLAAEEAARVAAEHAAQVEAERLESERLAAEEAARVAAEEAARLEAERLEAERLAAEEAARLEAERLEAERLEAERLEAERLAAEEAARLEAEQLEAERLEAERLEAERLEAERLEAERLAGEEAARLEAERLAAEEAARFEAERLAAEEAARLEAERLAAEEAARLEAERLAAEEAARFEAERLEAERLEAQRVAAEEAARLETEWLEAQRVAAEEAARLEAERLEAEQLAAEQAARLEADRLEYERIAAERFVADKVVRLEDQRFDDGVPSYFDAQLHGEQQARQEFAAAQVAADEASVAAAKYEADQAEATRIAAVNQMMAQASAPPTDPAHLSSTNAMRSESSAMLADFSRTGATDLPTDAPASEAAAETPAEPDYESAFQPFAQRDLADTASLLRELSSLGFEDEPAPPNNPSPASSGPASGHGAGPNSPRPSTTTSAQQKRKRGLFGR